MQIVNKQTTDLHGYERNSRIHSQEQISQIGSSITEFGFTNPILINPDNRVIAGHGRLLAANEIGMEEVPCIVLEGLSEAQERAYVIADNKIALNSSWDRHLLSMELVDISDFDFDMDSLGFSEIELMSLMQSDTEKFDPNNHWEGMPEFDQQDATAYKRIVVHFPNQEQVDAFSALVEQEVTEKTKYLWFPEIEIDKASDKKYKTE